MMQPMRGREPNHAEEQKRAFARMDIPALVEHARDALTEGDAERAVVYLRAAVRRAPLRQDLRRWLGKARRAGLDDESIEALFQSTFRSAAREDIA